MCSQFYIIKTIISFLQHPIGMASNRFNLYGNSLGYDIDERASERASKARELHTREKWIFSHRKAALMVVVVVITFFYRYHFENMLLFFFVIPIRGLFQMLFRTTKNCARHTHSHTHSRDIPTRRVFGFD